LMTATAIGPGRIAIPKLTTTPTRNAVSMR
jgi:hypothetical protein